MPHKKDPTLKEISNREENKKCIDCGMVRPQWASITYGVFLCLNCAGVHRSYGVKVSMVKSVGMDVWTDPEIKKMEIGGNKRFTEIIKKNSLEDTPKEDLYQHKTVKEYGNKLKTEISELFPELKDELSLPYEARTSPKKKKGITTPSPAAVNVSSRIQGESTTEYINRYTAGENYSFPSIETVQTGITDAIGKAAEYFYSASSTITGHLSEKVISPASSILREKGVQIVDYIKGKESNRRVSSKNEKREAPPKKTARETEERGNRSFDKWD